MSECKRKVPTPQEMNDRSQQWADGILDKEEDPTPYERTYRDGTLVNECWQYEKEERKADE